MASANAYTAVGLREDLTDKLIELKDGQAGLFSNIKLRTNAYNELHEWQEFTYRSGASNKQVTGFTPSPTVTTRTRKNNRVQILSTAFSVDKSLLSGFKIAGIEDEFAWQAQVGLTHLRLDINYALINNAAAVPGSDIVPPEMLGMFAAVVTNATIPADPGGIFTEDEILDMPAQVYNSTRMNSREFMLFTGSVNINRIANFKGINNAKNQVINAMDTVHNRMVTVIRTNFGNITLFPEQDVGNTRIGLFDMDTWALAVKREVQMERVAQTKDAVEAYWVTECTVEYLNEKANAKMTGITP
jgi:hypothetical protein